MTNETLKNLIYVCIVALLVSLATTFAVIKLAQPEPTVGVIYKANVSAPTTTVLKVANLTITDTFLPGVDLTTRATTGAVWVYFNVSNNKTGLCLRNATGTMTVSGACSG